MDCDRLKKIEELIYSASIQKNANKYINIYINSVISFTWDLGNLREEICLCRDYLKFISKYILLGDKKKIFNLLDNTTFFYDLIVEDFARWTIKKEILKLLNNCLCKLNTADINRISNEIYSDNSKFYIHKLIDILSIYGDYDFQALILEVIFRSLNRHELRDLSRQLIPESEKLRKEFLKIDIEKFDETARVFLNNFNERSNHIFSICCENVTLGSIHCGQNWDKHKGVWVDFNLVDGAISWYVTLDSFKVEDTLPNSQHNIWNLVTLFKDDVNRIEIKRLKKNVEVKIELNKPTLSFHKEYQHVIDNELFVCLELAHSAKTDALICNVLEAIYDETAVNKSKLEKTSEEIVQLNISKNNHKSSRKRKISIREHELIFFSNSSSKSNCLVCLEEKSIPDSWQSKEVLIGTQTAKKLEQELWPPTIHKGSSTVFKDKNVPEDIHEKKSVIDVESEADLLNSRFRKESDIDNMSVHFASEEQLLRMASDFDTVISLLNKGQKQPHGKSIISSNGKTCTSQYIENKRICTDAMGSNCKSSEIKHMEIFEGTSNTSRAKNEVSVSDIFKYSTQEKSYKESSDFDNNSTFNTVGVSKKVVEVDIKQHKRTGDVSKCTTNSHHKLKKGHKSSTSVNTETNNASSIKNKQKLDKRRIQSQKQKLNTKSDRIFHKRNITMKNYNIDIKDSVIKASISNFFDMDIENSLILQSFTKQCNRKSLKKENRRLRISRSIDKMRGEEEETDESVCSIPHFFNIPEIPVTPPPFLDNNSEHSGSSFFVRKVKNIPPLPITPLSVLNYEDNVEEESHNSHMIVSDDKVDLQKCEEKFGMKQHLVEGKDDDAPTFSAEDEVLQKNKRVEKEHIIANKSTDSPIWSRKCYIRLQALSLHSKDFLGFYYFIVFYHYDIFAKDMESYQEILIFNQRLQELNNLNTKFLLCYVGNIQHFLEKATTNKEYQKLQLPIIEDDGSFISLFLKHYLKNLCAKKSYILVDDNGFVVLKHIVTVDYPIEFDLLLRLTSNSQKIRSSSHSGE